jgi:tRNA A37 threonylcarbamoyladenosine dehydratase
MTDQFSRTRRLLGEEAMSRLHASHVLLFGLGGVGSFAAEALARAGIGSIEIVDNDVVAVTNINRQLVALHSTVGRKKTDVMKERILDINPSAEVAATDVFLSMETVGLFDFSKFSYVVDAIDTVTAKLLLADLCHKAGTPLISSMGTGNKLDPTKLKVCDVFDTEGDPLARVMRRELRKLGVPALKVVCSSEEPRTPLPETEEAVSKRNPPASCSFVPPVAGMILAGEVVKDLIRDLL